MSERKEFLQIIADACLENEGSNPEHVARTIEYALRQSGYRIVAVDLLQAISPLIRPTQKGNAARDQLLAALWA